VSRIERETPAGVRLVVDRREGIRPGEKYAHWELRGVPLRIVVGAKDLGEQRVTVTRRLDGDTSLVAVDAMAQRLPEMLEEAQRAIRAAASRRLEERSVDVATLDELAEAFRERPVFASAPFCNTAACEERVKQAVHAVTIRVLRADRDAGGVPCLGCGHSADHVALIARAY
jgi:prolyl-tRNA synthetase